LAIGHLALAMAMVIGYWLSAIDYWPLAIGYDYWLLIFTLRDVAMVMTHFGLLHIVHGYAYNPLAIVNWLLVLVFTLKLLWVWL
jgi:hypothetical protein